MSKFSTPRARPRIHSPIQTTNPAVPTLTHEGGLGFSRDPRSELFLLACANMVREQTFYEAASTRDDRFRTLVAMVTAEDPSWVARFVPYLRNEMLMRSASVVMACEYLAAGGPNARKVIDAACSRADEPAEILAYWSQNHGKRFPAPLKRGVADAVCRLYTPRAAVRYDGGARAWRMADVIELTHPRPRDAEQSALFRHLLDQRHHGDGKLEITDTTWERANPSSAAEWEALIPQMGYMALLRNLRNFDKYGVSDEAAATVCARLSDPAEVARSRQLPIRFYSAWKATASMRWGQALETALDLSLHSVPVMGGRTLIMVDISGSMNGALSERSTVSRAEIAALFGSALAKRAGDRATFDVVAYNTYYTPIPVDPRASILRALQTFPRPGGGTNTWTCTKASYRNHNRVIILTDEQSHDYDDGSIQVPVYTFNLAGYAPAHTESSRLRFTFGGLSDAAFRLLPILEMSKDGHWPF